MGDKKMEREKIREKSWDGETYANLMVRGFRSVAELAGRPGFTEVDLTDIVEDLRRLNVQVGELLGQFVPSPTRPVTDQRSDSDDLL